MATKKKKKRPQAAPNRPPQVSWLVGARVRTLPLAIAPVLVGAGAAAAKDHFSLLLSLLALAVAIFLQIGVNFANDFSDGIRGTDALRVGPLRLTGSGAKKPAAVRNVAFSFFGLAALSGIAITVLTQHWWMLGVGAIAIAAGWFYTGGKRPYGYSGLGDVLVFIFFGFVATEGTTFIQTGSWSTLSAVASVGVGLLACAVLMINNIRDIETDARVGKKTLAVRMGKLPALIIFCVMVTAPMGVAGLAGIFYPTTLFTQFVWLAVLPAGVIAVMAKTPAEYITVLKIATFAALAYGVLLGWGLAA